MKLFFPGVFMRYIFEIPTPVPSGAFRSAATGTESLITKLASEGRELRLLATKADEDTSWPENVENVKLFPFAGFL